MIVADVSTWTPQSENVYTLDPQVHDLLMQSVLDESSTQTSMKPQRLSFGASGEVETSNEDIRKSNLQANLKFAFDWRKKVKIPSFIRLSHV